MLAIRVAALVVPLVLVSGCGGDSDSTASDAGDTPSDTPSESSGTATESATDSASASPQPDWPACDSVWTEGGTIPRQYKGCLDGTTEVPSDALSCSSGQRIERYDDTYYGVAGGKIYMASGPLEKDKQYLKMVRTCRA